MRRFGEKLYFLRTKHSLSTRKLAEKVQISHTQIRRLENGVRLPAADLVLRIADFFGVDVNQLMRDELEVE